VASAQDVSLFTDRWRAAAYERQNDTSIFEVTVSDLLGARIENEQEISAVAEQLSRINEQLAVKNRRARRVWKTVAVVFIAIIVINFILIISGVIALNFFKYDSGVVNVTETETSES
jgi:putative transcriptional regulator